MAHINKPDLEKGEKIIPEVFAPGFGAPTDSNVRISERSIALGRALAAPEGLGCPGRLLFSSKSLGRKIAKKRFKNPDAFVPNANIFISGGFKVWHGDVMLDRRTTDFLSHMAREHGVAFYILPEVAGRFLSTPPTREHLQQHARWRTGEAAAS